MDRNQSNVQAGIEEPVVCVVGLGYVGLPLAEAFARSLKVIGFDINREKVHSLKQRRDLASLDNLSLTSDEKEIAKADFTIICVPTPVTKSKDPDLSYVKGAAESVSRNMKRGSVVILESTVYPGVTEEVMEPILEESGLRCGQDFKIAYSPERINPGDTEHTIDRVTKVVSGMDESTTEMVAALYSRVAPHIFRARNIKTAEAAKVIENIQRDLNIALMNELAMIMEKMGLDIREVLEAAATKWNFQPYHPGMVGGHCIPVDPYYLVYKAKELLYHPQVILAGRAINDYMPKHVAEMAVKAINNAGKVIKGSRVLIMGLTYKENVPDTRESPVNGIIEELKEYGIDVIGYDPMLDSRDDEFGIRLVPDLKEIPKVDCVIMTLVHNSFKQITLDGLKGIMNSNPVLIDLRGFYDKGAAEKQGFCFRTL